MSSSLAHVVEGLGAAGLAVRTDAPFGALTTYAVGGRAAAMVEVTGTEDVSAVAALTSKHPGIEVFVLGNGSNTLVADSGFDGLVVRLRPPADPDAARVSVIDGLVEVQSWLPLPVRPSRIAPSKRPRRTCCAWLMVHPRRCADPQHISPPNPGGFPTWHVSTGAVAPSTWASRRPAPPSRSPT